MTKLKQYSKNLARAALLSLAFILSSCGDIPKTSFYKTSQIPQAICDIAKNKYQINLKAILKGKTLWIYLPLENIVVEAKTPSVHKEIFKADQISAQFDQDLLQLAYKIQKVKPKEIANSADFSEDAKDKIGNVRMGTYDVLFNIDRSEESPPLFLCMVIADVKNGFEIKTTTYIPDLKKAFYNIISGEEFRHRSCDDIIFGQEINNDLSGTHLNCEDITMKEFIRLQINQRVRLKFEKEKTLSDNPDIDKEIMDTALFVLEIYGHQNISGIELENLITSEKTLLRDSEIADRINAR
ncbi:MAG: hypothetical protein MUF05_05100 [Candidatus Omnitrophica bacterium]|jgi:hypothetical protein|nr:hypothetical protein [Candidatus Omnitrophota bacterium]